MTGRIDWTTDRTVEAAGLRLPVAPGLTLHHAPDAGSAQDRPGIRPETPRRMLLKSILWPLARTIETPLYLGHGFLHRMLAREIRRRQNATTAFLEIGCGDMRLRHALRRDIAYNAVDFSFSQFQLSRVAGSPRVNLCVASVNALPVRDGVVTLGACVEVLHQIDDLGGALGEMRRVCAPGACLLVTVPNGYSRKYRAVGPAPFIRHYFTRDSFAAAAERAGFRVARADSIGRWVRLPRRLFRSPMQLPLRSPREEDNSYFVFTLEAP